MHGHAAGLRRLDGLIWALVALVAVLVLTVSAARGFIVEFRSFAAPGLTCLLLVLGARFYRDRRNEPKLASALESTAQIMAFAAVAAPLSYVAASLGLPLQDAMFDSLDRALGLNWRSMLAFIERWPEFSSFLRVMYLSLTVQMTAVVLLLGFSGRLPWLRVYMLAFVFATLTTIALSTVLPAEGVWLHYGLKGDALQPRLRPDAAGAGDRLRRRRRTDARLRPLRKNHVRFPVDRAAGRALDRPDHPHTTRCSGDAFCLRARVAPRHDRDLRRVRPVAFCAPCPRIAPRAD
jgi:hypothetical protein